MKYNVNRISIPQNQLSSFKKRMIRIMAVILLIIVVCMLTLSGLLIWISPGKPSPFLDEKGIEIKNSISEKTVISINGTKQGMFIRGRSINNPVILFLHGGPGMPEYFLAEKYDAALQDHFTVCYYEQRGAGISYNPPLKGKEITSEQLVTDIIEVTNYLRKRFNQDKILLVAHSWGTFIGVKAAKRAPELYTAYVGIGQITNMIESERLAYAYMLEQYTNVGDTRNLAKLKEYNVLESNKAIRSFFVSLLRDESMHRLGIGTMRNMDSVVTGIFLPIFNSRAYTLAEKVNIWKAKAFLRNDTPLLDELFGTDISIDIPKLALPAYFISGRYDYTVSYELSKKYFDLLQAPCKSFYTFEQSAHSPMFEEPDKFINIMLTDVLKGISG